MPSDRSIPLYLIDEPPLPVRAAMDDGALSELADDIRVQGVLQPIVVIEQDGRFRIVAGHRRYMASRRAEKTDIPARVFQPGEINEHAAMLAENIYREGLSAAEEAIWFAQLIDQFNLDEAGICKMVRKSPDYVGDRLRLLRDDPEVFKALVEGKIKFGVARELNKITDESMRRYYLHQACLSGVNHRTVAAWVAAWRADAHIPQTPAAPPSPAPEVAPVEPYRMACAFCGGDRDPYNLVTIQVHKWELEHIQRQLVQTAQEG